KNRGGTTRVTGTRPAPAGGKYSDDDPLGVRGNVAANTPVGNVADDDPVATSAPAPRVARGGGGPTGPPYQSALSPNNPKITIGDKTGPDLTDAQISAPMRDGSFIGDCGAPDDMGVTVKVAIRMGRAVGVSVSTDPPDSDVAGCIDRHVRGLSWPANPKTDS